MEHIKHRLEYARIEKIISITSVIKIYVYLSVSPHQIKYNNNTCNPKTNCTIITKFAAITNFSLTDCHGLPDLKAVIQFNCFFFFFIPIRNYVMTHMQIMRTQPAHLPIQSVQSFHCLFVLRFYGPVNPLGSCRVLSVYMYLTTLLLGRLSR